MLKLTRQIGEQVIVVHEPSGDKLIIEVLDVYRTLKVRLGLDAEKVFLIDREEVYLDRMKERENDDTRNDRIQRDPD